MDIEKPTLSVIIPVYNEEKTLEKIFYKVKKAEPKDKEIILVNDLSTDGSSKILGNLKKHKNTKIINHKENKGKGAAIKTGLEYCNGKIVIIQDADLEYNPEEYEKLIKPILKKETKVVYGSRFLNQRVKRTKFYYANKFLSALTTFLYNKRITDMETCYKALDAETFKNLEISSKRFDLEPEITSKLLKKGYRIKEIPISYNPRTRGDGKKINIKDGFQAIQTLTKYRLRKID